MQKPIDPYRVFQKQLDEQLAKLQTLLDEVDVRYAFLALNCSKLFEIQKGSSESQDDLLSSLFEFSAFHLFPKFGQSGSRDDALIQELIDTLEEANRCRGILSGFAGHNKFLPKESGLAEIQSRIQTHTEIVRGSGFPYQTRLLIEGILGKFESWFKAQCGIGPLRCLEILDPFEDVLSQKVNNHKSEWHTVRNEGTEYLKSQDLSGDDVVQGRCDTGDFQRINKKMADLFRSLPDLLPYTYEDATSCISDLDLKEWEALRNLIGLTPANVSDIVRVSDIRHRPVYFVEDDRLILFDQSTAYDAIFSAFDRSARRDRIFTDTRYVRHVASWMETEATKHFQRVFPASAVYRNLRYPDPNHEGGEAELDLAVHWGPFLLLGEVKGTQFRDKSRGGDLAQLRTDLERSIEDAFSQATRAKSYIEANGKAVFHEKGTGRLLEVCNGDLRRIFLNSITLHHFGGIATQLALLKSIGLFKGESYPWSVSLSDLELITAFVEEPDVLLHYIQRRIELQESGKNIYGDEIDVFGIYMDNRLNPSELWDFKGQDGKKPSLIVLTEGSNRFDEWHLARERGDLDAAPKIGLNLPREFIEIIEELRLREEDSSRWIAFALLSLSNDGIAQFVTNLNGIRAEARDDRRVRRVTFKDGDLVISLLAARGVSPVELKKQTYFRGTLEKYRLRTEKSVAIGINVDNPVRPFDYAYWEEGPWEEEADMEKVLDNDRARVIPKSKLPGRNAPCVCGRGKKFKKCCLDKIKTK